MMSSNDFEKYSNLDVGTNVAIRFLDGTIIKGTVRSLRSDMICVKKVSVSFPQKNTELKLANLDLKFDTFQSMIYAVPSFQESSA